MREKVGECTGKGVPSPRASPLTSCVLPAPRSPNKPITNPRSAVRPHPSPSASVSAGLWEMSEATCAQGANPIFVADDVAFAGRDFANAAQSQGGKLFFPRIEQGYGIPRSDSKKQFPSLRLSCIGKITAGEGITIRDKD